jgi:hypothetical protein
MLGCPSACSVAVGHEPDIFAVDQSGANATKTDQSKGLPISENSCFSTFQIKVERADQVGWAFGDRGRGVGYLSTKKLCTNQP